VIKEMAARPNSSLAHRGLPSHRRRQRHHRENYGPARAAGVPVQPSAGRVMFGTDYPTVRWPIPQGGRLMQAVLLHQRRAPAGKYFWQTLRRSTSGVKAPRHQPTPCPRETPLRLRQPWRRGGRGGQESLGRVVPGAPEAVGPGLMSSRVPWRNGT